ncbi:hypothetical protein ACKVMT_11720 [Halobacteriales archaeon Cl-PHB]
MEPWAWLAAYLVGFAFLQLLLYRYFREETSGQGQAGPERSASGGRDPVRPRTDGGAASQSDDAVHCAHCGARNERDPAYTFCRECANPLQ